LARSAALAFGDYLIGALAMAEKSNLL